MADQERYDVSTTEGIRRRNARAACLRIPLRFRGAEVTDPAIGAWCGRVAAWHCTGEPVQSLLITGPTGVGKTWQAYGAVKHVASLAGVPWLATSGPDLYARLRPRDGCDSEGEFTRWSSVPLLMIDDFGAGKDSAWTEEVDYRLVNHRSEHLLPVIYTTNLPVRAPHGPSLESVLSERVFSRLAECLHVPLKGSDRRRSA